jgi:hypothetical protein
MHLKPILADSSQKEFSEDASSGIACAQKEDFSGGIHLS